MRLLHGEPTLSATIQRSFNIHSSFSWLRIQVIQNNLKHFDTFLSANYLLALQLSFCVIEDLQLTFFDYNGVIARLNFTSLFMSLGVNMVGTFAIGVKVWYDFVKSFVRDFTKFRILGIIIMQQSQCIPLEIEGFHQLSECF